MIITRTPLRISLGGGGTDLPAYFRASDGGFLVAAAITKYVYVAVHPNFGSSVLLKYSSIENVPTAADVKHPLLREALLFTGIEGGIEVSSLADIPAGTGLGSSGTFTVGVLRALYAHQRRFVSNTEVAEHACYLEIDRLGDPVGKQDQYIAAVGGITAFDFLPDGRVIPESVVIPTPARERFEENLLLFYTGIRRSAAEELRSLDQGTGAGDRDIQANLEEVKASGRSTKAALEAGDLGRFASLLTEQWKLKHRRSPSAVHDQVNEWIELGLAAGGLGGKLVGAGGGGFLLFYAEEKADLRAKMAELQLSEVIFGIDYQGSTVIVEVMLPVVVLAGGKGTRVAELTGDAIPKAMIEVAGRPFIERKLDELSSKGVEEIYLLIGHSSEPLETYLLGRRSELPRIELIHDGAQLLGTGGAIVTARRRLPSEFWVTYGDTLLDAAMEPIEEAWRAVDADGLLVVLHNRDRWQVSNTSVANGVVKSYSKGDPPGTHEYIDYGLSIFRSLAFDKYKEGEPLDLASVWNDLIAHGRLAAYVAHARFDDIGTPESWQKTNDRWTRRDGSN